MNHHEPYNPLIKVVFPRGCGSARVRFDSHDKSWWQIAFRFEGCKHFVAEIQLLHTSCKRHCFLKALTCSMKSYLYNSCQTSFDFFWTYHVQNLFILYIIYYILYMIYIYDIIYIYICHIYHYIYIIEYIYIIFNILYITYLYFILYIIYFQF